MNTLLTHDLATLQNHMAAELIFGLVERIGGILLKTPRHNYEINASLCAYQNNHGNFAGGNPQMYTPLTRSSVGPYPIVLRSPETMPHQTQ